VPECAAGLHTLHELQEITDSFFDDDMLKAEAIRIQKLDERRTETSAGHTAPHSQARALSDNISSWPALRAKAVSMMQAAGTAHAATALPAQQLVKMLHESGAFVAPMLVSRKRCDVSCCQGSLTCIAVCMAWSATEVHVCVRSC
jgi:hypothetical protein